MFWTLSVLVPPARHPCATHFFGSSTHCQSSRLIFSISIVRFSGSSVVERIHDSVQTLATWVGINRGSYRNQISCNVSPSPILSRFSKHRLLNTRLIWLPFFHLSPTPHCCVAVDFSFLSSVLARRNKWDCMLCWFQFYFARSFAHQLIVGLSIFFYFSIDFFCFICVVPILNFASSICFCCCWLLLWKHEKKNSILPQKTSKINTKQAEADSAAAKHWGKNIYLWIGALHAHMHTHTHTHINMRYSNE